MSLRTLERRFALLRASWICDRSLVSSRLCSMRTSRCRDRLFCLSADAVRVASESRSLDSWAMSVSRLRKLAEIRPAETCELPCPESPVILSLFVFHPLLFWEVCWALSRTASRYGIRFLSSQWLADSQAIFWKYVPVFLKTLPAASAEPIQFLWKTCCKVCEVLFWHIKLALNWLVRIRPGSVKNWAPHINQP